MDLQFELESGDDLVYVAEAVEQIERIERGLLELERDDADEGTLAEIFRAAHTLKGSAATIGHARMAELTHALEEAFGALRDGRLRDLSGFGDVLLETVDVLRVLVDEVAAGHTLTDAPGPLARSITDRLAGVLAAPDRQVSSAVSSEEDRTADEPVPVLDPIRLGRLLAESVPGDGARSIVSFAVADDSAWGGVRLLQALLATSETGRLLSAVPSLEDIEAGTGGSTLSMLVRGEPAELGDLLARLGSMDEAIRTDAVALADLSTIGAASAIEEAHDATVTVRRSAANTIRIEVGQLDDLMNLVGELIVQKTRLRRQARQLVAQLGDDGLASQAEDGSRQFAQIVDRLQAGVAKLRMMPIDSVLSRFPRLVRDASAQLGKDVELTLDGRDTELDRSLLEEVGDPLTHLVRNALDHGIEPAAERLAAGKPARGQIRVAARHADGRVLVEVADDGRGMDPAAIGRAAVERGVVDTATLAQMSPAEVLRLVFVPGFSTAVEVTSVSGRGVGMDVVQTNVERLGGKVAIDSVIGTGTTITMSLPLTLAIIEALLVRSGERVCAIPLRAVVETQRVPLAEVRTVAGAPVLSLARGVVPLRTIGVAMGDLERSAWPDSETDGHVRAVLVRSRGANLALRVDEFLGTEEIVIKSIGALGIRPAGLVGATILADGRVALVLDVDGLLATEPALARPA